jgi:hypothetical protein
MIIQLSNWVNSLPISISMRKITWLIPLLQIFHIFSLGMILSSIVMINMRLWGVSHGQTAMANSRQFLPWIWWALAVATVSGIALMVGAPRSWRDSIFVTKLVLIVAATVATLAVPLLLRINKADGKEGLGFAAIAGALALALWMGATLAGRGRWIAGWLGI